jgi:hypothetical protein
MAPDMAISSAFWTLLQVVFFQWPDLSAFKITRDGYLDLRNRQVSFVHGLLSLGLGTHCYLTSDAHCGSKIIPYEYGIIVMSSGYFIYDFLSMAWFGLLDVDMTFHHFVSVGGLTLTLYSGTGANFICMSLFFGELSNPAMHMRVMLKHLGLRYTKAYEVAEFIFFVTYFFGRVIIQHPVVYLELTCEELNSAIKLMYIGILFQSYQFLYRMYFIVKRRFAEIDERNRKKLPFHWLVPIPMKELETC